MRLMTPGKVSESENCFGILLVRLLSSSGRAYNDIGFEIEGSGRKVGISTALVQVHAPLVLVLREQASSGLASTSAGWKQ